MFKKHRAPAGSTPGTLAAAEGALRSRIFITSYDKGDIEEFEVEPEDLESRLNTCKKHSVLWVAVQGVADIAIIEKLGALFNVHPLSLEDVINTPQRPKVESSNENTFIIACGVSSKHLPFIETEQISIVLGKDFILTFEHKYSELLAPVRKRARLPKGNIRQSGVDYLAYAILDTVVDGYYPVLEDLGEYLENLEDQVVTRPSQRTLEHIYRVRREMLVLRRNIFPQREMLSSLLRDQSNHFKKGTIVYLRDCYDHCVQIIDVLESYRDVCTGLMDAYLSGMSNKTNEIMKVLTVISTIFIPLTFLAGVYGMNFEHMPELQSVWGYPIFWTVNLLLAFGMLVQFRRSGWLGGRQPHQLKEDHLDKNKAGSISPE